MYSPSLALRTDVSKWETGIRSQSSRSLLESSVKTVELQEMGL